MKPLNIEFSTSISRRRLRLRPWTLGASLVGLCLCSWAILKIVQIRQGIEAVQAKANVVEAALVARRAGNRPPPPPSEAQVRAVNRAIHRLNLPWWQLFAALQRAADPKVALLTLEPDASTFKLSAEAEAVGPTAMLDYLEMLKHDDFLKAVTLTHHEVNATDPNRPVRFRFEVTWRGNGG